MKEFIYSRITLSIQGFSYHFNKIGYISKKEVIVLILASFRVLCLTF